MRIIKSVVKIYIILIIISILLYAMLGTREGKDLLSIIFFILFIALFTYLAIKVLRSGISFPTFGRTYFQGRAIQVQRESYQGNWLQRYREYQSLQVTAEDDAQQRVTALMVGSVITGQISNNDEIRIYGTQGRDGIVRTSRIYNISKGHWVNARKYLYCFIATAVTGSAESKEVVILKRFRDEILMENWLGILLIELYYLVSPAIASLLRGNATLKKVFYKGLVKPGARLAEHVLEKRRE
jgi:hypothetical protein